MRHFFRAKLDTRKQGMTRVTSAAKRGRANESEENQHRSYILYEDMQINMCRDNVTDPRANEQKRILANQTAESGQRVI